MAFSSTEKIISSDCIPLSENGKKPPQYLGAFVVCLSALCAGTTMGWTSAASGMRKTADYPISEDDWSWVGSILGIGATIFALPVGSVVNFIGRKRLLLILAPLMTVGWACIAWSSSVVMLLAGRLIVGAVTGGFCVIAPLYTGEIAESSIRGILGSFFQLMLSTGIFLVYVLGMLTESIFWTNVICGLIPLAFGAVFMLFPDSPRWFLSKGRTKEARSSLLFFRGSEYDIDRELQMVQDALQQEEKEKVSFFKAFSSTAAKRGLMLSLGCFLFQEFSGIIAVEFYASDIFQSAGVSLNEEQAAVIVAGVQILFTYLSSLLIDRLGRKVLLFVSGAVMALCNLVIGIYFFLQNEKFDLQSFGWIPILSLCVFVAMFSIGFGPVPSLYTGEIFSPQIKGVASSLGNIVNWVSIFIVSRFYADVNRVLGTHCTFWGFAIIDVIACIFVCTLLLETKGKTLEEIQQEIGRKPKSKSIDVVVVNY